MTSQLPRTARFAFSAAFALGAAPVLGQPAVQPMKPVAPQPVQKEVPAAATCATATAGPLKVASDPEEGGQVSARKSSGGTKPKIGDMTVTHKADTASTKLMTDSAPPAGGNCAASPH